MHSYTINDKSYRGETFRSSLNFVTQWGNLRKATFAIVSTVYKLIYVKYYALDTLQFYQKDL